MHLMWLFLLIFSVLAAAGSIAYGLVGLIKEKEVKYSLPYLIFAPVAFLIIGVGNYIVFG